MKKILMVLILILSACATAPKIEPDKDDRKKPTFGIKFDPKPVDNGIKIEIVFPFMAASKAGLKSGDILTAFNDEYFGKLETGAVEKFVKKLSQLELGSTVKLTVLRDNLTKDFSIQVVGRTFSFGNLPVDKDLSWPKLPKNSALKSELDRIKKKTDFKENLADLEQRFTEMTTEADVFRSPSVEFLQRNPFQIQEVQKVTLDIAQKCDPKEISNCLQRLNNNFSLANEPLVKLNMNSGAKLQEQLQLLAQALVKVEKTNLKAFSDLSSSDLTFLKDNAPNMLARFAEGVYLHEDEDKNRLSKNLHILELMLKIKQQFFAQSLFQLSSAVTPQFFLNLKKILEAEKTNLNHEIVSEYKTDLGSILVGGTKNNNYAPYADKNILLIFDLGGDDFYPNISSNIVDLAGDDTYESYISWSLASAAFGSRILLDLRGNDKYICTSNCLAASLFGSSLLMDFDGNDVYRSVNLSESISFAGFSALVDVSGDDRYESLALSQAVGIAGGKALLLDLNGNDTYYSKGLKPSGYKDPGQFEGWSQGVGLGIRNFISGGIGFLYDKSGADTFESGTFSQGGGYYFGFGILINDGNENDTYRGARYTQGFVAHYGIGSFLEVGGNDTYSSTAMVGQGMAWDLGLSLFEDLSGNDSYKTCEPCLGGVAQNSFAFFIDHKGKDNYQGQHLPYAENVLNDYHAGFSFGLFQDRGGQLDSYEKFKNNTWQIRSGHQILVDE